jgi:hypothetical protein
VSRVSTVTTAKMTRVLKALAASGHGVGRMELRLTGEVVVYATSPAGTADVTDLDSWRAGRALRKAQGPQ